MTKLRVYEILLTLSVLIATSTFLKFLFKVPLYTSANSPPPNSWPICKSPLFSSLAKSSTASSIAWYVVGSTYKCFPIFAARKNLFPKSTKEIWNLFSIIQLSPFSWQCNRVCGVVLSNTILFWWLQEPTALFSYNLELCLSISHGVQPPIRLGGVRIWKLWVLGRGQEFFIFSGKGCVDLLGGQYTSFWEVVLSERHDVHLGHGGK